MKKVLIILCIIIIWIMYITADCIRLKKAEIGTKPFITTSENRTDTRIIYTGLGYKIEYYVDINNNNNNMNEINGHGAEFRLFNKILIWAWIE